MDDQSITPRSLQGELTRWIAAATLLICTLGGITTGLLAYFEAKDLQDEVLLQVAQLVSDVGINAPRVLEYDFEESTIIAQSLNSNGLLSIPGSHANGFVTVEANDISWRALVITKPSGERFAVAQQTELIEEIAWANVVSAILPIGILAIILMGLIHWIIAKRMKPISTLARQTDAQTVNALNPLGTQSVPMEIVPFIEAINRLLRRTKQTIHRQRRFIADASHELRTPITALSLLAENSNNAQSESEQLKHRNLIQQGLDRLNNLVNQLLNLTRLQNTDSQTAEYVQFDDIVKDVLVMLHPLAEQKNIDLGIVQASPATVENINKGLAQLVENAIANAIRYTPQGGRIDVGVNVENSLVEFTVTDTGPGINEAEMEAVLTPFYRGKNQMEDGSGLGLAICSEIAKLQKGKIALSNVDDGGLRFSYIQMTTADSGS